MWKDIAPEIYRQRAIIEGRPGFPLTDKHIKDYLTGLSRALNMKTLIEPVTHKSEKFGWAGWVHWETSGCHFYAWDKPFIFFSSDIYTCKAFGMDTAVEFTRNFFQSEELAFKDI
jgi:S-adenosylmethionine decarboxylase